MSTREKSEKRTTYFIILSLMIVLSLIFFRSFYWPVEGMKKRKVVVGMITAFGVVVVPFLLIKVKCFYHVIRRLIENIKATLLKMIENRKK